MGPVAGERSASLAFVSVVAAELGVRGTVKCRVLFWLDLLPLRVRLPCGRIHKKWGE
jgi:hypothetical protein